MRATDSQLLAETGIPPADKLALATNRDVQRGLKIGMRLVFELLKEVYLNKANAGEKIRAIQAGCASMLLP